MLYLSVAFDIGRARYYVQAHVPCLHSRYLQVTCGNPHLPMSGYRDRAHRSSELQLLPGRPPPSADAERLLDVEMKCAFCPHRKGVAALQRVFTPLPLRALGPIRSLYPVLLPYQARVSLREICRESMKMVSFIHVP